MIDILIIGFGVLMFGLYTMLKYVQFLEAKRGSIVY